MSEKLEYLSFKIRRLATRIYDPYKNTTMYGEPVLDIIRGGMLLNSCLHQTSPALSEELDAVRF